MAKTLGIYMLVNDHTVLSVDADYLYCKQARTQMDLRGAV